MDAGIWCVIQLYIGLHTSIGGSGQLGLGATKRVEDASISWVEVSFLIPILISSFPLMHIITPNYSGL